MIYQGRELVELKYDTMQHWPKGRELLAKVFDTSVPEKYMIYAVKPDAQFPFFGIDSSGEWISFIAAAELPPVTKRRVTRAECAGMAVKYCDGSWASHWDEYCILEKWNEPMPTEIYIDRALTLADALAGRTLGMEVEG